VHPSDLPSFLWVAFRVLFIPSETFYCSSLPLSFSWAVLQLFPITCIFLFLINIIFCRWILKQNYSTFEGIYVIPLFCPFLSYFEAVLASPNLPSLAMSLRVSFKPLVKLIVLSSLPLPQCFIFSFQSFFSYFAFLMLFLALLLYPLHFPEDVFLSYGCNMQSSFLFIISLASPSLDSFLSSL